MNTEREVSAPAMRRIEAAIRAAAASREVIDFDWPECHRKNCPHRHGDVDSAFGNMKHAIDESIRNELHYETVTRPDIHEDGDTPEQKAVYLLAHLMHTYRVQKTSTFVRAAQLMVDAYPKLIDALSDRTEETR